MQGQLQASQGFLATWLTRGTWLLDNLTESGRLFLADTPRASLQLDDLKERLGGPDAVAEMTGRSSHQVRTKDGSVVIEKRNRFCALKVSAGARQHMSFNCDVNAP